MNFIVLREHGIYNLKVWLKYLFVWREVCDLNIIYLFRLAITPVQSLIKKKNDNIENLKNTFIRFSETYTNLYVYGAEQKAQIMVSFLNKMNINITGYIVTSGAEKYNNVFNGLPVENFTEIKTDDKKNGIIIGLNKYNEKDVITAILTSSNKNQILYGLSEYDKYCIEDYLEN